MNDLKGMSTIDNHEGRTSRFFFVHQMGLYFF